MKDLGSALRPVPFGDAGLREDSRRVREDFARREAMLRAEQAGMLAGAGSDASPVRSEADVLRFGAQLKSIEESGPKVAGVGAVLLSNATLRGHARRLADSLRNAERIELRVEQRTAGES